MKEPKLVFRSLDEIVKWIDENGYVQQKRLGDMAKEDLKEATEYHFHNSKTLRPNTERCS